MFFCSSWNRFETSPNPFWRLKVMVISGHYWYLSGKRTGIVISHSDSAWHRIFLNLDFNSDPRVMVTSMLVTNFGDQMCWWQGWDVGDRFRMLVTDLISEISHHHKVTNITMSSTSLSPWVIDLLLHFTNKSLTALINDFFNSGKCLGNQDTGSCFVTFWILTFFFCRHF